MPRPILLAALIATMALWGAGCGSCGRSSEESAPPGGLPPATPQTPAPPASVEAPSDDEDDEDDEDTPVAEVTPLSGRLVEKVADTPASFWNLPVRRWVVIRAQTARVGAARRDTPNPREWPPMTLAVLDRAGGGEPGDYFNKDIDELFQHLVNQKVYTAALPLLVLWNAFVPWRPPEWSVAVPVAEGTRVQPPLALRRLPALKVHAEPITPASGFKSHGPKNPDRMTPADILRTMVANMHKRLPITTKPTFAMVRFPDCRSGPNHPDSVFEFLFAEPVAEGSTPGR